MSQASSVRLFVLFSQPHCLEHIPNFQHPRGAHSLFSRLIEIMEEDTISDHAESDSDSEAVSGSGRSGNERKSRLCSNPSRSFVFLYLVATGSPDRSVTIQSRGPRGG